MIGYEDGMNSVEIVILIIYGLELAFSHGKNPYKLTVINVHFNYYL